MLGCDSIQAPASRARYITRSSLEMASHATLLAR